MSLQQTKEQERAEKAWNCVVSIKDKTYADEYGSVVKKVPMLILTNGLGQTLAFLKAKGKNKDDEHEAVFSHLSEWVTKEMGWSKDLLTEIRERNSHDYRRATTEAIAFIGWLKRFAEAADL